MSSLPPALAPGKTAVITGAASGIGRAAARAFAKLGMRVCLADRLAETLEDAAQEVAAISGPTNVLAVPTDVSSAVAVDRLATAAFERFGTVEVLMNNAGIGGGGGAYTNPEGWQRVLGVNLLGVLHGVQRFVPPMLSQQAPGLIINTGSKQGITTPPGDTAYNVSKAGIKALTEGLAHSLRNEPGSQLTAHLLIPGFTHTGMTAQRTAARPPGAWTADQVIDRLLVGLAAGEFYIWCQDNETTREQDERRVLWAAGDVVENRPALSRWHPDYKDRFEAFMREGR